MSVDGERLADNRQVWQTANGPSLGPARPHYAGKVKNGGFTLKKESNVFRPPYARGT